MITIQSNQRLFVTGMTGSGKSYWIKKFLGQIDRFVFYDPKFEHGDINATVVFSPSELLAVLDRGVGRVVYRPMVIDDEDFNCICKVIYNQGNLVFVIDELFYHVTSSKITDWHSILLRVGRKRGVGVWNCTQRPRSCLHNTILSETNHIVCFKLMLETDRRKLAESFDPLFMTANSLEPYYWIYNNSLADAAVMMPPV